MARADGRLIIGSRVHMAWPDPLARLVENGQVVIDVGGTHANQPTFRLAKETYHRLEIEMIVDAISGRSLPWNWETEEAKRRARSALPAIGER